MITKFKDLDELKDGLGDLNASLKLLSAFKKTYYSDMKTQIHADIVDSIDSLLACDVDELIKTVWNNCAGCNNLDDARRQLNDYENDYELDQDKIRELTEDVTTLLEENSKLKKKCTNCEIKSMYEGLCK